jgi:hypothetical protein
MLVIEKWRIEAERAEGTQTANSREMQVGHEPRLVARRRE